MPTARSRLLDASHPDWVHCISRCVRRVSPCGRKYDYRRAWVEERLRVLTGSCAIEVATFAVMANHPT